MRIFCQFTPSILASWLLPIGLGLGKEYGGSKASSNKWDWKDVIADVIGIIIGIVIFLAIHLIKK